MTIVQRPPPKLVVPGEARKVSLERVRFADIGDDCRERVFSEMAIVASQSTGADTPFEESWMGQAWPERCKFYADGCEAYLARSSERLVGYVVYCYGTVQGRPITHLLSAYVLPEFQGRGIAFAANARAVLRMLALHPLSQVYVAGCVYNPIALDGWRRRVLPESFYPRLGSLTSPRKELRHVAEEVASSNFGSLDFDSIRGVLHNKNPGRRSSPPLCSSAQVNEYFAENVGSTDTVLFVIEGNRRLLMRELSVVLGAIPRMLRSRFTRRHGSS